MPSYKDSQMHAPSRARAHNAHLFVVQPRLAPLRPAYTDALQSPFSSWRGGSGKNISETSDCRNAVLNWWSTLVGMIVGKKGFK